VVIDYLWGRPTELLLEALAKGFRASSTRPTRLVEVGESAGKTITLPGATLRSVDLTLMGSGFGVYRVGPDFCRDSEFVLDGRGREPEDCVDPIPLPDVEAAWSRVEKGRRIVFTV